MKIDRRQFFKNLGLGGVGALLLPKIDGHAYASAGGKYGVLVDVRNCVNCKACQIACKLWNGNDPDPTTYKKEFTSSTWSWVQEVEAGQFPEVMYHMIKRQCMHCESPQCVEACPQEGKAIHKEPNGMVLINHDHCIRCESCTDACPYGGVPRLDEEAYLMRKCTFCVDRVRRGIAPSCVDTCPAGALQFGKLEQIKAAAGKAKGKDYPVYGIEGELASSWIYVFPKGVSTEGIKAQLTREALQLSKPKMWLLEISTRVVSH